MRDLRLIWSRCLNSISKWKNPGRSHHGSTEFITSHLVPRAFLDCDWSRRGIKPSSFVVRGWTSLLDRVWSVCWADHCKMSIMTVCHTCTRNTSLLVTCHNVPQPGRNRPGSCLYPADVTAVLFVHWTLYYEVCVIRVLETHLSWWHAVMCHNWDGTDPVHVFTPLIWQQCSVCSLAPVLCYMCTWNTPYSKPCHNVQQLVRNQANAANFTLIPA